MVECGRHLNIKLKTLSEVINIAGSSGDFTVTVKEGPRYVDTDKCIACGDCTEKCPKSVNSDHDAGAGKRKAIYVQYAQAVPLKYQIDPYSCLRLETPGTCGLCEEVCDAGAINFSDSEKTGEISVGAVVLAPGLKPFNPSDSGVWGYGVFPNVITSLQFERYLSVSGPTGGRLVRPSDGRAVNKVAFLQCIGSRDENLCDNRYCSSVCCMYAIKEAMIAKEHVPGLRTSIFHMDRRAPGKESDRYMERAVEESGVRFVRCRVNGVEKSGNSGDLRLSFVDEEGRQVEELYDMVVLSVGLQTSDHVLELAYNADIKMTGDNFAATSGFSPVQTSRAGIFACGSFTGPKNIPESVVEGSAAAAAVAGLLAPARFQLSTDVSFPEEKDVLGESVRIGVFVCHCGSSISSVVDVLDLEKYAAILPDVVHVERNLFSCSHDSQDGIVGKIKEHNLNRVVIAACSPRTHEPLFRTTMKMAGLNEYLLEIANIRNQNSWVHGENPRIATSKAKDLVRMAVARVACSDSLAPVNVPIIQKGLVIGGGITGMTAALNMAEQGFEVHMVERTDTLGGHGLHLRQTWSGEHVPTEVTRLVDKVIWNDKIVIHKEVEVTAVEGFVGNFKSTICGRDGSRKIIEHGIGIVAIGAELYLPNEYSYGSITRVVTSVQFDKLYKLNEIHVKEANNFVFIQCVGSREENNMYCSKVCCTHSVQTAIGLKKDNPSRNVYILYRDMRTYSQREGLYREARKLGVIFINYELHGKPEVRENGSVIDVEVWDHVLHRPLQLKADMVILAVAIRPMNDASTLADLYKIPVGGDGFFQEAHVKIRPVDLPVDGMFVAGLAHYPKPIEESVAQALAASARAVTLLSKKEVLLDAVTAIVDNEFCDGCALCVDVCPYNAITLVDRVADNPEVGKLIVVNKAQCKGCGVCQSSCPKRGVFITGFTMDQIGAQIKAALAV